jgi:hypothetical protein
MEGASSAEGVVRSAPRVRVSAGERIALAVDVAGLHFFDAETGDAIGATGRMGVAQLAPARQQGEGIG